MIKPNWDLFKAKFSENPQDNFEWFCYLLFCREFYKPHGVFRYKDQSGIETDPIEVGDEIIGWQAKFYEDTLSRHKSDLLSTLEKTRRDYPSLTKLIFYTNSEWGQGRGDGNDPVPKRGVEEKATHLGIVLEWRTASYFESPFVSIDQKYISSYFFDKTPLVDLSPEKGWFPYENWSNPSHKLEEYFISDEAVILNEKNEKKPLLEGLHEVREVLSKERSAIRLVGLSGVGKTRFVQAIFDERVGENALDPSLVCYTDMSREPDPSPVTMSEQLLAIDERGIVIIDNCPPDLHRELVKTVSKENSKLTLLTVEYDVKDDLPEETTVFKLEPNSHEVIEKIIKSRFAHISQVDARRIAEFSGGNARIAIALAHTVRRSESLSGLRDEELFKRLFQQRNDSSENLMRSAEVLSLVYSFNGKEVGEDSELACLASLAGIGTGELYRDVQELRQRELIQVRGDWRAVLPHAISSRLAKRALEFIPVEMIVDVFLASGNERIIKSFAHRLSFLHDSEGAKEVAGKWLAEDGWLGEKNCRFNGFEIEIFEYIAPVLPEKILECLERAAQVRDEDFFNLLKNKHYLSFVYLLRHIAYESRYFDRAVRLIVRFVLSEKEDRKNTVEDILHKLFGMYFSGTHATISQRAEIVKELLASQNLIEEEIGFSLLSSALETGFFGTGREFEFGARSRDFGWQPKNLDEKITWYRTFIEICVGVALSEHSLSDHAGKLLAENFRGLWKSAVCYGLLEETAKKLHKQKPWIEGWLAVKETIQFDGDRYSPEVLEKIENIERYIRPKMLYDRILSYVLSKQPYESDCYRIKDEAVKEKCRKEVEEKIFQTGQELASNEEILLALFSQIISSGNSFIVRILIQGVVSGYTDKRHLWRLTYDQYQKIPKEKWRFIVIETILYDIAMKDSHFFHDLMDRLLEDELFAEYFPRLQMVHLDQKGIERLHKALDLQIAFLWQYEELCWGRRHEVLSDEVLSGLLEHIFRQQEGVYVVLEILNMRFFGKTTQKYFSKLIELGYDILAQYPYFKDDHRENDEYKLPIVAKTCFENNKNPEKVQIVFERFYECMTGFIVSDYTELQKLLAAYFPDMFLEYAFSNESIRSNPCGMFNECLSMYSVYGEIPEETILQWCENDFENRVHFILKVINPLDEQKRVKPVIYQLLQKTDDMESALDSLLEGLIPSAWSGSDTNRYVRCMELLEDLKQSEVKSIRAFAENRYEKYQKIIRKIRERELRGNREMYERFE